MIAPCFVDVARDTYLVFAVERFSQIIHEEICHMFMRKGVLSCISM